MSTALKVIGWAVYRLVVCILLGYGMASITALCAAGLATASYGDLDRALMELPKSPYFERAMLGVMGAYSSAFAAGLVCGLASLPVAGRAFRSFVYRVVLPGGLAAAAAGAACGIWIGANLQRTDEPPLSVLIRFGIAAGALGPLGIWLVGKAIRAWHGRSSFACPDRSETDVRNASIESSEQ
jgi:hypothetical protein